jgi:hypothetical protein
VIKITNHPTKNKSDSVLIKKINSKNGFYEYDATWHHWDGKDLSFN